MFSPDFLSFPTNGPRINARVSLQELPGLTNVHYRSSQYSEVIPPFDDKELTFRSLCMWTEACKELDIPVHTIKGGFSASYYDFEFDSSQDYLFECAINQLLGKLPVAGHVINLDGIEVVVVSIVDENLNLTDPIDERSRILQLDIALVNYFEASGFEN